MQLQNRPPPLPATDSEAAAARLRHDILSGALPPDARLKVRELIARYGIGASPMREALSQLAASGLVLQQGQKGFRVPPVSIEDLADITASRQIIEAEALRLAMQHNDAAWEDEIVASFHLFERQIVRFYDGEDKSLSAYEDKHHRFHRALIAACPLRMLKAFCDDLYVRKTRYRALTRSYNFDKNVVIAEHRVLMNAVLDRHEGRAIEAIRSHIGLTADVIRHVLPTTEGRLNSTKSTARDHPAADRSTPQKQSSELRPRR
jgi:GntR family carbon starvation induced transcriptional regulator